MTDDWRVDTHDKEIERLKDDLLETKEKLRDDLRKTNQELRKDLRATDKALRDNLCETDKALRDDLLEAKKEIWALERRPQEWLNKALLVIAWVMAEAILVVSIVEAVSRH
jgi:predicted RNase H-like nuclease (RuvC/YqgF family)